MHGIMRPIDTAVFDTIEDHIDIGEAVAGEVVSDCAHGRAFRRAVAQILQLLRGVAARFPTPLPGRAAQSGPVQSTLILPTVTNVLSGNFPPCTRLQ